MYVQAFLPIPTTTRTTTAAAVMTAIAATVRPIVVHSSSLEMRSRIENRRRVVTAKMVTSVPITRIRLSMWRFRDEIVSRRPADVAVTAISRGDAEKVGVGL